MRGALQDEVNGYPIYEARRAEYAVDDTVPFRVADQPLRLSTEEYEDLQRLCQEITSFVAAADNLFRTDEEVTTLLNRGKPETFTPARPSEHLFVRPDLIIADQGFVVCEIETSVFGLGLAHAMNRAYLSQGHETLVNGELAEHLTEVLPEDGVVIYSDKTKAYKGQLSYLADLVFSDRGRNWVTQSADEALAEGNENDPGLQNIYRAFYLQELETDAAVREIIERGERNQSNWLPSLTPHMEEKAMMALLWDKRWEDYFRRELGDAGYNYLQTVIPATWIIGEEEHFIPGMPGNVADIEGIASLPRSKRSLVLKSSGYDDNGSWAEGVQLLHQKSRESAARLLAEAAMRQDGLQIVQEFKGGKKIPITYTEEGASQCSGVRIRLTPYVDTYTGKIIAAKATGRSGTDFIHASSDSVNCSVGIA